MSTSGSTPDEVVQRLLDEAGTTYADEAGIRLKNPPMPLFQLLVLCLLFSKPRWRRRRTPGWPRHWSG